MSPFALLLALAGTFPEGASTGQRPRSGTLSEADARVYAQACCEIEDGEIMTEAEDLKRVMNEIEGSAMPEFLEDGSVKVFATTYEANSLVACAFRNYRDFILEGG